MDFLRFIFPARRPALPLTSETALESMMSMTNAGWSGPALAFLQLYSVPLISIRYFLECDASATNVGKLLRIIANHVFYSVMARIARAKSYFDARLVFSLSDDSALKNNEGPATSPSFP